MRLSERRISRSSKESRVTDRIRLIGRCGLAALAFVSFIALAGCNKGTGKEAEAAAPPLMVSPEALFVVSSSAMASGPSITGSIEPERRADLRAEVSAVVLAVLKENGDQVRRGDLLVQLDDTAIREALASAEAATRAGTQAFEQAERQFERMKTLRTQGMVSQTAVEDAEIRRNNLQSEVEAAKTRVVLARQQVQRTEARASLGRNVGCRPGVGRTARQHDPAAGVAAGQAYHQFLERLGGPAAEGIAGADVDEHERMGRVDRRPGQAVLDGRGGPWLLGHLDGVMTRVALTDAQCSQQVPLVHH
jgi:multidrug efflux pump subunit AcrA (membrane-fusion protein)